VVVKDKSGKRVTKVIASLRRAKKYECKLVPIHKAAFLSWLVRKKTHGVEPNPAGSISDRR
jgi:hypothetical protein